MKFKWFAFTLTAAMVFAALTAAAGEPVKIKFPRQDMEAKWRQRIQSFLDKGVIPLIDLESSLKRKDGDKYLDDALESMDELGVALIAFDGYPENKDKSGDTYDWGYYIHRTVNAHPDRFILATNGGTNANWLKQGSDFVDQTETQVRSGDYPIMGEFDFRHYMSASQCRAGRTGRDNDIPLSGANGHRIFKLSRDTGVPFVIHLEPEDKPLDALEEMLAAYPKAKVIVAHFGQIRHPSREKRFGPDLVRRLLGTYPNLTYDLSTGDPGRQYRCNNNRLDTVIWKTDKSGRQKGRLKPQYEAILTEFSGRFVAATDYGGGRSPLPKFLRKKVGNVRLIIGGLPDEARHNIGYRNAWKLLTGKEWR